MATKETLEFDVDKSIIVHLIKSQAGTLGKGVLECVMNAVDAGSEAVHIDLDLATQTLVIRDTGHGFRSRDEVETCFKRFGFDHSNHQREFGKFGLGRGQIWNWCAATYRSNTFAFDVDIRARGLKWDLTSNLPPVQGTTITASFYEPLKAVDQLQLVSELERLCKFSTVPVFVNGRQISKEPAGEKWSIETDDAYVRITEGNYLHVYNQGVHVCDIWAGSSGLAGTLVTKRGRNLMLNMARNDILRAECPIWKRLAKLCQDEANRLHGRSKTKRYTDSDRAYLAQQTIDPSFAKNFEKPLFTLADGRHRTLRQIMDPCVYGERIPMTVAERGNGMAEKMLRDRTTLVLAQTTLERFGVSTVTDLITVLSSRLSQAGAEHHGMGVRLQERTKVVEDIKECPGFRQLQAQKIPHNELTKQQAVFLRCAAEARYAVHAALYAFDGRKPAYRDIILGRSDSSLAYTDGASYIAIVDTAAEAAMKQGLAGFLKVVHLLVHEMLHDDDDTGSHAHDLEFMSAFHDITIHHADHVLRAASKAFTIYCKEAGRLKRKEAEGLDLLDADVRLLTAAAA